MTAPTLPVDVLTDLRFDVPPAPAGPPATVAWLRSEVARFGRGPDHAARRQLVVALLAGLDGGTLRRQAYGRAEQRLRDTPLDLMEAVARPVPVAVLAEALGAGDVVADVLVLAPAYLPPAEPDARADAAVARLMRSLGGHADTATANRIGLLAQACAATAGLIGNAAVRLLGAGADESTDDLVSTTLAVAQPAIATRRTATDAVREHGYDLAPGDSVLVELAGAPFGAGAHACPGGAAAVALACGVLDAVRGLRLLDEDVSYVESAVLRAPSRLWVGRA